MSQDEHFAFVKSLARELNGKKIELPSFPDVVLRIRTALDDPDMTANKLATILSVDPVLASRVLIFANSTYYNPAGTKIEGLDAAVGRIGFREVRTTAISYAVEQLHASKDLEGLNNELRQAWSTGLRLAAMSEVIARDCTDLDADSAFIAGLLHRIGVLYIFTKYNEYPSLLQDPVERESLIDEWVAPIGESIVGNWNFSDDIKESLNPNETDPGRRRSTANLADVVILAKASLNGNADELCDTPAATRVQLTAENMPAIMESYQQKLDSLASSIR